MTTTENHPSATTFAPLTPPTDPAQLHTAFGDAINAHDVDALAALYHPDGLTCELDGSQVRGAAAIRGMLTGLVGAITHIEATTRKLYVAGDVALSSAEWTATIALPDGSTMEQTGTTAEVSMRQPDGTWAFVIDDPMFS